MSWEWSLTIPYEIYEFFLLQFQFNFFLSLKIYRMRFVNRNRLWLLLSNVAEKERKRVKKKIDLAAVALEICKKETIFAFFLSHRAHSISPMYTQTCYGNSKLRMYSATKSRIILWKLAKAFCHKIFTLKKKIADMGINWNGDIKYYGHFHSSVLDN
jgi:hypothetical protein